MGPLPKRKVSKSRKNRRRAHHHLAVKHLVICETCGEYHVAHQVCGKCGSYKCGTVITVGDE